MAVWRHRAFVLALLCVALGLAAVAAQGEAASVPVFDKSAPPLTAKECERVLKKMMHGYDQALAAEFIVLRRLQARGHTADDDAPLTVKVDEAATATVQRFDVRLDLPSIT